MTSVRAAQTPETLEVSEAVRAKLRLCTDGKSHYVLIGPYNGQPEAIFSGDGKSFALAPAAPDAHQLGPDFFDPRFRNDRERKYKSYDLRLYSRVNLDALKQTCAVRCGTREIPLSLIPADKSRELVSHATFVPNPQNYVPYKLARDDYGIYYYVDRGATDQTRKEFRVFVGPRGHLKQLPMMNLAADSHGDIFASPDGKTRLLLPVFPGALTWVTEHKASPSSVALNDLPTIANLDVIYNELGIYAGQRLGTPCDDL